MANRFIRRRIIMNNKEIYKEYLNERGVKTLNHYDTPKFNYPSDEDLKNISFETYIWKQGDKLANLSEQYYGSGKNWWIIARFNKIGSEANLNIGDIIRVPLELNNLNYILRG